jgi:hypothetical protein
MDPVDTAAERRRPSEQVIDAIAERAGVDPIDLEVPLGDVVDADALDALFDSQFCDDGRRGRVEFTYQSFRVSVVSGRSDVSVEVEPVEETAGTDSPVDRQEA